MTQPLDLAHELLAKGQRKDAAMWARRALALDPQEPAINNVIGVIADARFDVLAACQAFGRALTVSPQNVQIFSNVAAALGRVGIVGEAVRVARRTLALAPGHAKTINNMAQTLTGAGYIKLATATFRRSLAVESNSGVHSNLLFTMSYDDQLESPQLFAEYRRWECLHARPHYALARPHPNSPDPDRRLVVGYLSQDFRAHTVGHKLRAIIANHGDSVQVNSYAAMTTSDEVTASCLQHSAVWRDVTGRSDGEIAELIRHDRVDVLVVVAGHTANGRLLVAARRPAPIQASIYDISTTGLEVMDYWLSDQLLHPEKETGTERFTETILRLPCFFLLPSDFDAPDPAPPPAARKAHLTFGSFNNTAKLSPETLRAWAAALHAVPGSRLLVKYLGWCSDPVVQERIRRLMFDNGIDQGRIEFDGGSPDWTSHFESFGEIDVALDTFPFGGWTTTFEALWMGVPVITLAGDRFSSRFGLATLSRIGLGDLVAKRPEEYGSIAARLAGDPGRRAVLRSTLRETLRRSPLSDGRRQARDLEEAYRSMWRLWCRQAAPASLARR